MKLDIEGIEVLPIDQQSRHHLLEGDVLEHIGAMYKFAERGKPRFDAEFVSRFVAVGAHAFKARDDAVESGGLVIDRLDVVHRRHGHPLVDLQTRAPPDAQLAIDIEPGGCHGDIDLIVGA
ncbi:hypothetical protein AWB71_06217 [Caballeronia peredens]|nr:hypothetical protein AWB71_06217 [Caballeronia peredens]